MMIDCSNQILNSVVNDLQEGKRIHLALHVCKMFQPMLERMGIETTVSTTADAKGVRHYLRQV
jgi:hypothetical protein